MPAVVQCGVFTKSLREEFKFRNRGDGSGTIRKMERWER